MLRWQAVLFGVSLPILLPLTDRWAAIGGLVIMVAFLLLRPLVAGGGVPSATQDGARAALTAPEEAQAVESPRT